MDQQIDKIYGSHNYVIYGPTARQIKFTKVTHIYETKFKCNFTPFTTMKFYIILLCSQLNNMGINALLEMYAKSPRAAGRSAEGKHIRQSASAHDITTVLLRCNFTVEREC